MDGGVRFKRVNDPDRSGLIVGANSYALIVVADDGNGGTATQSVTVNLVEGASATNSYDNVTLDWENGS